MRILCLKLEQFRNHRQLRMDFTEAELQVLVGSNGAGKTNVLESVSVLAFTKSFLGTDEENLRTWGTDYYRITAAIKSDTGEERELEIVSQILPRRQKACFMNGVKVSLTRIIGELPLVMFLPQDLSLFTGPPAERRRYLDQILCQVSPEYFASLMEYQRILKQRNALLKAIREGSAPMEELGTWDRELAERGSAVTLLRLELVETFNLTLVAEVAALGEPWSEVQLQYHRSGEARTHGMLVQELVESLLRNRERDIILQSTLSGPHRDDWTLVVDGRPVQSFASRGQQRVSVLALLFLEASYLELKRSEKPIILLDDIFSELDDAHRDRILQTFKDHQVLMTSTHLPPLEDREAAVWSVDHGEVVRSAPMAV